MTSTPVLVAYGSTRGSTAEIAQWVGMALTEAGIPARVLHAREVRSLDEFGPVILGGALYVGRWHRDARRFARRLRHPLQRRPVWLFASGPLDDSADGPDHGEKVFGAKAVRKVAERVHARGTTVFGGRLAPDARGFPAASMARNSSGDFRDRARITGWARDIAAELERP